ncbi:hypothetical protein PRZ48_012965 [Zasmidium cellare]|uniref:Methyltransferase domain-containing protein n=1 Tax=Zasmidium cellare TaxID=395010 RepID=A0ABR0E2P4_ZASCE|nr:hypothetical protein PRZ48_012965 [Zasmidium cellare]
MAGERSKYYLEDPELGELTKELFRQYVGIQGDEEIVQHIKAIRDKAWQLFNYPCIGGFSFVEMQIHGHPLANEVFARMKTGKETLLDLGCCFAQDIRSLVFEGAPSDKMTGFDLRSDFVEFGYDLFRDRKTLKSEFVFGDFFEECGLKVGSFDIIHASAFFHLFNWEEQVEAVTKAIRLLKPKKDSLILGRQAGSPTADSYPHPTSRSGEMFRHDPESFDKLVNEVARRTGMQLKAESAFVGHQYGGLKYKELEREGFRVIQFSIRMV